MKRAIIIGDAGPWGRDAALLDDLGITIRLSSLPSWPRYQPLRRWRHGGGWLQRLWRHRIYPHLFPRRYAEAQRNFEEAQRAVRVELAMAILECSGRQARRIRNYRWN